MPDNSMHSRVAQITAPRDPQWKAQHNVVSLNQMAVLLCRDVALIPGGELGAALPASASSSVVDGGSEGAEEDVVFDMEDLHVSALLEAAEAVEAAAAVEAAEAVEAEQGMQQEQQGQQQQQQGQQQQQQGQEEQGAAEGAAERGGSNLIFRLWQPAVAAVSQRCNTMTQVVHAVLRAVHERKVRAWSGAHVGKLKCEGPRPAVCPKL